MLYLCHVARGLATLHNCNLIHGGIKPSAIYISDKNVAMLSELAKMELDAARHTGALFSKVLMSEAIPKVMMYWSPEIISQKPYSPAADIWALGVTFFQACTGEHPFDCNDENVFIDDVMNARVDWSRLVNH
jgi:eukaryotic-like serine/threonine-protein kinase